MGVLVDNTLIRPPIGKPIGGYFLLLNIKAVDNFSSTAFILDYTNNINDASSAIPAPAITSDG